MRHALAPAVAMRGHRCGGRGGERERDAHTLNLSRNRPSGRSRVEHSREGAVTAFRILPLPAACRLPLTKVHQYMHTRALSFLRDSNPNDPNELNDWRSCTRRPNEQVQLIAFPQPHSQQVSSESLVARFEICPTIARAPHALILNGRRAVRLPLTRS